MPELFDRLPERMEGSVVVLEPLSPDHEEPLYEAARDERIWRWMPQNSGASRESFHDWMRLALDEASAGVRVPFATLDAETGVPIGSASYLTLRPEHLSVEIGWTWISPARWKSGANVEAKLLMFGRAFEEIGCRRVELKTDANNERSRRAMEALPTQFEGVLRKHMIVRDGERRDSAYYSVTDDEWPEVKANLLERLSARA